LQTQRQPGLRFQFRLRTTRSRCVTGGVFMTAPWA
jgi:hypothetical protein